MKGHVTGCTATAAAPPASSPACARQMCMLRDCYVLRDTQVLRYRLQQKCKKGGRTGSSGRQRRAQSAPAVGSLRAAAPLAPSHPTCVM